MRILQEEIISMGTEPVLVQRPGLARAKASEVTAELPILENLANLRDTGETVLCRWLALNDKLC